MTHGMEQGHVGDLPRSEGLCREKFGLPGCGEWEGKGCSLAHGKTSAQLLSVHPSHGQDYKVSLYFKELAWFTSWPV